MIIGIYYSKDLTEAKEFVKEIRPFLEKRNVKLFCPDELDLIDGNIIKDQKGYLLSFGGDGTFLRAAQYSLKLNFPILGINLGNLGFLTDVEENEIYSSLENLLSSNFIEEERLVIEASLIREGEEKASGIAINDFVIAREVIGKILEIEVYISGIKVGILVGDGAIISTPTGSTGYSLSIGGPILAPTLDGYMLSPLAPHKLSSRPIVIPSEEEMMLKIKTGRDIAHLIRDGKKISDILNFDYVRFKKSEKILKLIHLREKNFYKILNAKFKWGI